MSMQDNEIDEIFRSKLGDLEVQPTERVWKGIRLELDGAKTKRTLMPVFRIAAAIAVFLAAGLYFLLKDGQPDNTQNMNAVNVKHHGPEISLKEETPDQPAPAVAKGTAKTTEATAIAAVPKARLATTGQQVSDIAKTEKVAALPVNQPEDAAPKTTVNNSSVASPGQLQVATTTEQVKPAPIAVVPDQPLNLKPAETDQNGFIGPVKTNIQLTADANTTKPARKRHGIRSLGDLINVVVAKVDKRDDKVIEFSNTDDDESTITGINLGLVKVKKEK